MFVNIQAGLKWGTERYVWSDGSPGDLGRYGYLSVTTRMVLPSCNVKFWNFAVRTPFCLELPTSLPCTNCIHDYIENGMRRARQLWKETVICMRFGSCQFPSVKDGSLRQDSRIIWRENIYWMNENINFNVIVWGQTLFFCPKKYFKFYFNNNSAHAFEFVLKFYSLFFLSVGYNWFWEYHSVLLGVRKSQDSETLLGEEDVV